MEPCQPPSSAGAAGNHRCFAKAQQSAWRLVWAGGQAAAVVEAGFSDPRPGSTTSSLSGDLGKTSAAQHLPGSEHMCVDAAEVAQFVLKSSVHYCPPRARC